LKPFTVHVPNDVLADLRRPPTRGQLAGHPSANPAFGGLSDFSAGLAAWITEKFRQWTETPKGGHFALIEQPALLAADMRRFIRLLRASV
jgi:pimeloyl-ACP methyl ester carboxylesterase